MQHDSVDDVPVFWASTPGPLTAGLLFGVGRRDESFVRGGITHLVEHLAMEALGRTTLDCNATVDVTTTEFTATGEPSRVVDFLRRICEALSDLSLERLSVEAAVLRAEDGLVAPPVVGALVAERYGASGVGLAGFREPAVMALTSDDVRTWLQTFFVRGNAALWLSGPPPAPLSLPLPPGVAPARPPQRTPAVKTPALVEHTFDGTVALGAEIIRAPGVSTMTGILRDRVEEDLRRRRGVSYTVATEHLVVEGARRFVAVTADCRDGQEAVVGRALWQCANRLAESGPTAEELAHDRDMLYEYLADERSRTGEVRAAAEALVIGVEHRSSDELRREATEVTTEQVQTAARTLLDGALLGLPMGAELGLTALTPVAPSSDVVQGQSFPRRRLGSEAPRGARLVVGDEGATAVLGAGQQVTVRYADAVALLEIGPQEWSLVGADGTALPLAAGDWRDGDRAVALVRAAVPAELHAVADDAAADVRRVVLVHAALTAAFEALWPSKQDTWVARTPDWTLVLRDDDEVGAQATSAGISAAVGRNGAVLLLEHAFDELRMTVFHRGKQRDRHVWTGEQHDPSVLAELLGADREQVAELLTHDGPPDAVLTALEQALGVPEQTRPLLLGAEPDSVVGLTHERARGVRESMGAAMRGEYDPPDSDKLMHRMSRWERERPPAYRLLNAAAAAAQAAICVVAAGRTDGDWTSWPGALAVLFGLGAAGSLWSTRPPSR